jgi:hypothetical protein
MTDTASGQRRERFGWRTLRLPPLPALVFGTAYGAIVGAVIAWDIAVVLRLGRLLKRRITEEIEHRRDPHGEGD